MNCYICIDLGGTNLRAALADTDTGQVFHQRKCPTLAAEGQGAPIQRIIHLFRELILTDGVALEEIKGIGIGGTAGEFGHQVVEVDGLPCGCGVKGCRKLYASGPAMGVKDVMHGHTTCIGELVNHDLNQINVGVIVQAAREGDQIAKGILKRAGRYLGIAVGNILGVVSSQKVIFGGDVSATGDLLLSPILHTVRERVHVIPVEKVKFVLAELGMDSGLIGAVLWAKRRCEERGETSRI